MPRTSGSIAAFFAVAALGLVGTAARAQAVPAQAVSAQAIPDRAAAASAAPQAGEVISSSAEVAPSPSAAEHLSQVRIVRLSQVKGEVKLDRLTGQGFEAAYANLPIAQGQRLETGSGIAEVEFEDNSTLRITPNTLIEFPALERRDSGATVSTVRLLQGTAYASLASTKGNDFKIVVGNDTVTLMPSAHIRLESTPAVSKLAILNGSAELQNASGTTTVGKKKALSFHPTDQAPPVIAKNDEPEPFDEWDSNAANYHKLQSVPAAYAGSSYAYGLNDMNYYGGFSSIGSCGSVWRPYFATAGWDPFANGIWAWYPGSGYSWVSPYPWGWTPFHSGSWAYCGSNAGWGWRPNRQWNGLQNHPTPLNPGRTPIASGTLKPPLPPASGHSTLSIVSTAPLNVSKFDSPGNFVFHNNSAGMGVPRDTFGKLGKVSATVAQHGSMSTSVPAAAVTFSTRQGVANARSNAIQTSAGSANSAVGNNHAGYASPASHSAGASHGSFSAPQATAPATPSAAPSAVGGSHH